MDKGIKLRRAEAREREAFMAGVAYCSMVCKDDWDAEQGWQQYRCKDDADWVTYRMSKSEEDALFKALISSSNVVHRSEYER